ncbi:hypothetical protein [Peptoniphilus sp. HCN-40583]
MNETMLRKGRQQGMYNLQYSGIVVTNGGALLSCPGHGKKCLKKHML